MVTAKAKRDHLAAPRSAFDTSQHLSLTRVSSHLLPRRGSNCDVALRPRSACTKGDVVWDEGMI